MKKLMVLLCTIAAGILGLVAFGSSAFAAGPPSNVNFTATMSFTLKADQPDVNCYLHNKPGAAIRDCVGAEHFGIIRTDEDTNRIWFVARRNYAVPTGSLVYVAKSHPDKYVNWYGSHRALSRTFGGIHYHVAMGHIEVLRAQRF